MYKCFFFSLYNQTDEFIKCLLCICVCVQVKEWAVALFDFPGQTAEDLSFHKGALIQVTEHIDAEWRRGCLEGRDGLYPAAFTQPCQGTTHRHTHTHWCCCSVLQLWDFKGKFEKGCVCLWVITLTTTSSSHLQRSQSQDSSQRWEPWPSSTSQPRARTSSRWRCVCHTSPCFLSCRNKFTHI